MTQANTPELSGEQTDKGADVLENQVLMNEIKALKEENDLLKVNKESLANKDTLQKSIDDFKLSKQQEKEKQEAYLSENTDIENLMKTASLSEKMGQSYKDYYDKAKDDFITSPKKLRDKQIKVGLVELFFSDENNTILVGQGSADKIKSFYGLSEEEKIKQIDYMLPFVQDVISKKEEINIKAKASKVSFGEQRGKPKYGSQKKKYRYWQNRGF